MQTRTETKRLEKFVVVVREMRHKGLRSLTTDSNKIWLKWKDGRSNNIQFDHPDTPHTRLEIRKSPKDTSCSEKYTCLENPEKCYFRNIQYELRGAVNNIWKHLVGQSIICTAHIFIWSKRQWKLLLNYLWESLKKNNFPSSFSTVCEVSCVSPNPRSKVTLVGSLGPSPLNRPTS